MFINLFPCLVLFDFSSGINELLTMVIPLVQSLAANQGI
jgi:hypothetical protein